MLFRSIYATQPLRSFWKDLAKCNREEFAKSGTIGKYIEARELIIALPEGLYHYEHDYLIKHFATDFKKKYGVDCYAALHHNKRKTNFHIHLIFAERTKLEKPVVKVASRNMFYDERGKHVRTKKEILDASGDIRNGCKIIIKVHFISGQRSNHRTKGSFRKTTITVFLCRTTSQNEV